MATAAVFILIAPAQASLLVAYVPSLTNPLPFGVAGFSCGRESRKRVWLSAGCAPLPADRHGIRPGLPVAGGLGRDNRPCAKAAIDCSSSTPAVNRGANWRRDRTEGLAGPANGLGGPIVVG
jgi:hypothetical protein